MSFKTYKLYKDSGIAWLGKVPSAWTVTAIKHGFNIKLGKMLQPEQKGDDEKLGPYVRSANIQWQGVDTSDIKLMWFSPGERLELSLRAEDLLVSEGGDVGRACLWRNELVNCHFQNSVNRVRSKPGNSTRFARYWLSALKDKGFIDGLCNKSTIAHYTAEKLAATPILLPSHSEQLLIASFLDCETAKIDSLIAEQKRLIERLQEKRQAVISHAVTKGLNPNAPMKDSGVEWLGEIPEHWKVKRIKHISISIEQGWSPQCESDPSDGEVAGVLKVGCVNGGVFRPSENKALPPELEAIDQYSIKSGDLLVSRANTRDLVGSAAVAECDFPWLHICDKLYRISINPEWSTTFYLALYLASKQARGQIELGASGASQSMQNISQSVLLELSIPVPPLQTQEEILRHIKSKRSQIEDLISQSKKCISLFQERRSALISAVVTGQIDVRGLVQEEVVAA